MYALLCRQKPGEGSNTSRTCNSTIIGMLRRCQIATYGVDEEAVLIVLVLRYYEAMYELIRIQIEYQNFRRADLR